MSPVPAEFRTPQAWTGRDLAGRSDWICEFTAGEIAELDAAVAAVEARGIALTSLRRADFPLQALAATLGRLRHEMLHGRGFFFARGVPVGRYTPLQRAIALFGIGQYLGEPVSQNGKGHVLGHVKNLGLDFSDPETRGYQTSARLAYHTDYSDVVGLICVQRSKAGGASSIVSSTTIWNELLRRRPDLAEALTAPLFYTRWGEIPEGKKRYSEIPVFTPWQGRMIAFMNTRTTIMKAQAFPEVPRVSARQLEALDYVDTLVADPELHLDMDFQPGDLQFLCNHFIFHSRTSYEDWPEPGRRRHLLRLWLACDDGPELPPVMANDFQGRTGSGRPNGIHTPGVPFAAPIDAQ